LVFSRIVGLRDSWAKQNQAETETTATEKADALPKETAQATNAETKTRPQKKSRVMARADEREKHPQLAARLLRYGTEWQLGDEEADVLSGELEVSDFFEAACASYPKPQSVAKWMMGEVLRVQKDRPLGELPFGPGQVAELARRVDAGELSASAAKAVFAVLVSEGGEVSALVEKLGVRKVADEDALAKVVDEVLCGSPENVARYREGKKTLLGFFVGQVLKATGGAADPSVVRTLITSRLDA
jgi:glutaminyl-tRNA synthetase